MALNPSRRDTIGPPPRDISDLAARVRHQGSYLQSLDPGIQQGRFATPRPVPGGTPELVGGDSGGGDDSAYEWQWDDRYTVRATGTQRPILTYEPVEESLFVRWHPKGRGGLPLTNELFSVDGQVVTIPDPGLLAVGDQFSFQYQFDPGVANAQDAFDGITVVGATSYYGAAPHPTSFALPVGTAIDDLIVVGAVGPPSGGVMTDPRLTNVAGGVWIGRATDLSAVQLSNVVSTYWAVMVGVFRVTANPNGFGQNTGTSAPANFQQLAGSGAIAVACGGWSVVDGGFDLFAGSYAQAGSMGTGKAAVSMGYWTDLAQNTTPTEALGAPSVSAWSATTIAFGA